MKKAKPSKANQQAINEVYATGQFVNLFGYSQDELLAKQY